MEPIIKDQPSTKTNNMSLKGIEIIIGDNIIIPIDIKTLATTRSIITNGMYIKNPIEKALFNSEVMNAGTNVVKGTSDGSTISSLFATSANMAMSVSRV
jgi:hypothetical protein